MPPLPGAPTVGCLLIIAPPCPPPPLVQCLIPEVLFQLHGEKGMFAYLEKVLSEKGHAVVCVAEGAGQDILATGELKTDASGNPILKDVGPWLRVGRDGGGRC